MLSDSDDISRSGSRRRRIAASTRDNDSSQRRARRQSRSRGDMLGNSNDIGCSRRDRNNIDSLSSGVIADDRRVRLRIEPTDCASGSEGIGTRVQGCRSVESCDGCVGVAMNRSGRVVGAVDAVSTVSKISSISQQSFGQLAKKRLTYFKNPILLPLITAAPTSTTEVARAATKPLTKRILPLQIFERERKQPRQVSNDRVCRP